MMVVDDMASMPPRKRLFMLSQPKSAPRKRPTPIMQNMTVQAAMTGPMPILTIFLKENSSPRVNIRKITPISDHRCMLVKSSTEGV